MMPTLEYLTSIAAVLGVAEQMNLVLVPVDVKYVGLVLPLVGDPVHHFIISTFKFLEKIIVYIKITSFFFKFTS